MVEAVTDEPVPPTSPTPPTEPVQGPATPERPAPPTEWWKKPLIPEGVPAPESRADAETRQEAVDIIVGAIDMLHDNVADRTGYGRGPNPNGEPGPWGWRLSPKMIQLWVKVIKFLLRRLKMKDWDIVVALVGLAIAYLQMGFGYMEWRRRKTSAGGTEDKGDIVAQQRENGKIPAGAMGMATA